MDTIPKPTEEEIKFDAIIAAIKTNENQWKQINGVFGVTPGYSTQLEEGEQKPVILFVIHPGYDSQGIPSEVNGIPTEVRIATPKDLLEGLIPLSAWEGILAEAAMPLNYKPPPKAVAELKEMKVSNVTCHIGPDSGWSTLKPFLKGTTKSLTVAMYQFLAPYIHETVEELSKNENITFNLILQEKKNEAGIRDKLSASWGDRLVYSAASVSGPNKLFKNSYHTKVAVRDGKSFWMSSGNWSKNSQPEIEPGTEQFIYRAGNREWHVIIEDKALAKMYEKFIKYDMKKSDEAAEIEMEVATLMPDLFIPEIMELEAAFIQDHPFEAKTFATTSPVKVKPLMSPDNYAAGVLELIRSAEESLYIQFSYVTLPSLETFDEIINEIAQKIKDGLDVRILLSSSQDKKHTDLLIKRGWKRKNFRSQKNKMHNKGILVDGKIAVVGSNNWSSDGTMFNRDTSIIFYSKPIAEYFTEVFLFDWDNFSKDIATVQEITPMIAPEGAPTPAGMVRVPWDEWYD